MDKKCRILYARISLYTRNQQNVRAIFIIATITTFYRVAKLPCRKLCFVIIKRLTALCGRGGGRGKRAVSGKCKIVILCILYVSANLYRAIRVKISCLDVWRFSFSFTSWPGSPSYGEPSFSGICAFHTWKHCRGSGSAFILVGWIRIRIQMGKNNTQERKKVKKIVVLRAWYVSFMEA